MPLRRCHRRFAVSLRQIDVTRCSFFFAAADFAVRRHVAWSVVYDDAAERLRHADSPDSIRLILLRLHSPAYAHAMLTR